MSLKVPENRDHNKIMMYLSIPTTVREINQILYLSHESIHFYAYLSDLGARMYCIKLSMSIPMVFASEFWNENGVRYRNDQNSQNFNAI